ncbi:hypothetical protein XA3_21480 [Xylocopilactobacillus apicola]|uniref:Integrase catalytic domain-containing protein n=2 Tax=Xylocopilactobacillus apicola TaxID=2932184 RepID=A0AAU9D0A6_9LACO|nr:hypothetical protein XA3_21480 [Xylocopilactobacillus apicola]
MEVDWAGSTLKIIDSDSGELIPTYLFVATLPCSSYSYCEAFLSMKEESWLTAHLHAYEFFGGVTQYLISDNLKTGVKKYRQGEAVLNDAYRDLAEYCNTIAMPAKVRKPKDKPSVEKTVGILSTWVIAALRNQQFFTLEELNKAVRQKLSEFNERPFSKKHKAGNRLTAFKKEEQFALKPLPAEPYKMTSWKKASVQRDYHVNVESQFYSVPYEYISNQVQIKLTKDLVEIFYQGNRIASHKRLKGKYGQFSTNHDHLPANHQLYLDHTIETATKWAEGVGINTLKVMRYLLKSAPSEKQGLKAAFRFKGLARNYAPVEIEAACIKVNKIANAPSISAIERVLKNKQQLAVTKAPEQESHGFSRGAEYFERKNK